MTFSFVSGQTSPYLTQYILRHLLNNKGSGLSQHDNQNRPRQRHLTIDPSQLDRKAIEEAIYGDKQNTKLIYPEEARDKIKHYLDEAKQLTDVIDFHQPESVGIE